MDDHFPSLVCCMSMELFSLLSGQVESPQVISGTEEGPRRPEEGQFLTSTRTRGRGRLETGPFSKDTTHHIRIINLLQTQISVWLSCFYLSWNGVLNGPLYVFVTQKLVDHASTRCLIMDSWNTLFIPKGKFWIVRALLILEFWRCVYGGKQTSSNDKLGNIFIVHRTESSSLVKELVCSLF